MRVLLVDSDAALCMSCCLGFVRWPLLRPQQHRHPTLNSPAGMLPPRNRGPSNVLGFFVEVLLDLRSGLQKRDACACGALRVWVVQGHIAAGVRASYATA